MREECEVMKRIFISHSEKNESFVHLLLDYIVGLGVSRKTIFCSSDYRSGVQGKISDDVFHALKNTKLDIIILSNEYKKSEYCLNEAGVIRSKENQSIKIVIVLPDIQNGGYAGFINEDYWQYRLEAVSFTEALGKRLWNELKDLCQLDIKKSQRELVYKTFQKGVAEYRRSLPTIENLNVNWSDKEGQERARKDIRHAYESVRDLSVYERSNNRPDDHIFFQEYERSVMIGKGTDVDKIRIKTITCYTIVNLSDSDIVQEFSSQFLKADGGVENFSLNKILINGQENSDLVKRFPMSKTQEREDSPYRMSSVTEIKTRAHSSDQVYMESIYEINPDLFFQSKVINYPCGQFCLRANFDKTFYEQKDQRDYIFRYQIIPPDPYNLENQLVPPIYRGGSNDKKSVFALYTNGFPSGGGYVLVIGKK